MSGQALNLRRLGQIVRRHKILVGVVTALGLFMGVAYSVLTPPALTSTALVVLPQAVQSAASALAGDSGSTTTTTSGPDGYMAAQVVIATSDPVLSGVLPTVRPAMSLEALRSKVKVTSPAVGILSFSATGRTAAQAEATANAAARSYTRLSSASTPTGRAQAHILDPATVAAGRGPLKRLLIDAVIGAVIGALIGIIAALAISRSDRRLRERDEIAASIGVPVLAALPVDHPGNAADWTKLLEDYKPGDLDAWRLRSALRQLGMTGFNGGYRGDGASSSLAVLSLSSDPGAFALGPQLAVFAASLGIPTALIIGPQQDTDATAMLRTACAVPPPAPSKRSSHLAVTVSGGDYVNEPSGAVLTVVVTVVDAQIPQVADMMRTTATVLGISAGATTAEQLARTASSLAADGREIAGILVADPEPADRTVGRIPDPPRPAQDRPPARLKSMKTEIRR